MKVVRTGFHGKVDNPVARFTVFSGESALKDLELLYPLGRDALVPLRVRRYQRNRNAIDENIRSAHLPAIELKIIRRVASGVITHVADESWYQGDELRWVANRAGNLQWKVVHKAVLNGGTHLGAFRFQLSGTGGAVDRSRA